MAQGFSQVEGIDYDDIFSPVVRYESVRLMVTLAVLQQWHMSSIDVKTAFLYGELVSHPDSTCHLTRKLSSRFRGLGLVAGVPPTRFVWGVSGCPS